MQINRLFEMIYILMEQGGTTAAELAERFEVSTRTIYRDVDTLSGAGIPVYASKGKGGGIRLLPDFVLNKSLLTHEEQNEILFALQGMSATNATESAELVLDRLRGLFQRREESWIDVDFSPWGSCGEERNKFALLKTGILEREIVTFFYYNSAGKRSRRSVEPVMLRFKSGNWYLQGFCLQRDAFRTFKICRMEEVSLTGARFERRGDPPELDPFAPGSDHPVCGTPLLLRFTQEAGYRVLEDFNRRSIQKEEGGSFLVTACIPADEWMYGFLLSYGDALEVLSPAWVREGLRERAERIAASYAK